MEPNDEVVERQKLVPNDVETEEEAKSAQTPATPVAVPKINVKYTPYTGPPPPNSCCFVLLLLLSLLLSHRSRAYPVAKPHVAAIRPPVP